MGIGFYNILKENLACKKTNVTFRIIGDDIVPDEITTAIGTPPSKSFAKGELYKTKTGEMRRRPIGHWSITSENAIQSKSAEKHAKYIMEILEIKTEIIKKYIETPNIRTSIIFWWEAVDGHGGFTLSRNTLLSLCQLCNDIDYQFIG